MIEPGRPLRELMDLSGRVALVTGGAGHIGFQAACALAELGADVALADIAGPAGHADEIRKLFGTRSEAITINLADEPLVKALPGQVVHALGGLDIVVHSAAFVGATRMKGWAAPFEQQSPDTWRQALEVNLTSLFVLAQAAAPALKKGGRGSVITLSSIYGMEGPDLRLYEGTEMGNPAAYAASKGGLIQLTRWLSTVLAPKIRVNTISPGGIFRGQPDVFVERYESRTPAGRMGREEDLKGAVAFLASDMGAYVTGQNIVVDGGWTAW